MILDYEALGVLKEIEDEVKDFKPGDRVIVRVITPDWDSQTEQHGFSSQSGGLFRSWKYSNFKNGSIQ